MRERQASVVTQTVYIAKIGSLTKVGYTAQPVAARMRAHKRRYGIAPVVVCTAPGGRRMEKMIHEKLAPFRVRREGGHGVQEELFALPDVALGFILGFLAGTIDATVSVDLPAPPARDGTKVRRG